ncbi:MAG: hypothetical protein GC146_10905 [Limimaricola sp.]|uniref:hypothetical protein n=1 Tax=Limimaricola sp. TaxID=2211665 RepID=UPI001E1739A5|nr:hypothetical protein [Limimaricola sp.]MBI1417720.1 hypothetical protein [Limimaricola sp.]
MRRALRLLLWVAPFGTTVLFALWTLTQNPFAQPLVARSAVEVQRALDRALAGTVTPDWLRGELAAALDSGDYDRVVTLQQIAADQGLAPDAEMQARIDTLTAERTGTWATIQGCAQCMADIATCPSLTLMATCALPLELSPLGDLNTLRREAMNWAAGDDVDRIDVTLAFVGLAATGAIVLSGGTTTSVKIGTTALRLARRLGTLTPRFARELARLADIGLRPAMIGAWAIGRAPLDEVVDTVRLGRLADVGGDIAKVAGHTSLTDTIVLMRNVDTAEDAAKLAKTATAMGPKTRRVIAVLGKNRVFRALVRLSHLTIAALAALYLSALQALAFLAHLVGRRAFRQARRMV